MNKSELINSVASSSGLSKAEASNAVDCVMEAISISLAAGEDVRMTGFGTFSTASRAASVGRNPSTGEKIQIAASTRPKFKAGKSLKDAVNK